MVSATTNLLLLQRHLYLRSIVFKRTNVLVFNLNLRLNKVACQNQIEIKRGNEKKKEGEGVIFFFFKKKIVKPCNDFPVFFFLM
jgi:hypothetical protein